MDGRIRPVVNMVVSLTTHNMPSNITAAQAAETTVARRPRPTKAHVQRNKAHEISSAHTVLAEADNVQPSQSNIQLFSTRQSTLHTPHSIQADRKTNRQERQTDG